MKFNAQVFGYITSDFDFFLYDLSTKNYAAAHVKVSNLGAMI